MYELTLVELFLLLQYPVSAWKWLEVRKYSKASLV